MPPVTQPVQAENARPARLRLLARVLPQTRNLRPFLTGLFLAPLFIFLHEAAHFVTARALGIEATMHSAVTSLHSSHRPQPWADLAVTAAGPGFEVVVLGGAGLVWLYRLRRSRRADPATWWDWVATWLALNAARWITIPFRSSGGPTPDEVRLVKASGCPVWLGLTLLAVVACYPVIRTVRLHPRGARLVPFAYGLVGGFGGVALWLRVLGPRLLP